MCKSVALMSVSAQPSSCRMAAVALPGAGEGPPPSKQLAVGP
jgi:hypothetical protein